MHLAGAVAALERWRSELAAECDPDTVTAVWQQATAGFHSSRGLDGLRASTLTPAGVPFEASLTGGAGTVEPVLRYVAEAGTHLPFFTARLAAQRTALGGLVDRLPEAAAGHGPALATFVDVVFPDPGAIPARNRFATYFGIVHHSAWPAALAGLKVYAHLCGDWSGLDRLVARWDPFEPVRDRVAGVDGLWPAFAALEVDGHGRLVHKLYVRPRHVEAVGDLAERHGAELKTLVAELEQHGAAVPRWSRVLVGTTADGTARPGLTVYLPAKSLGLDPAAMQALARGLARHHYGSTDPLDAVDASSGDGWHTTIVGLGLAPGGGIDKLNLYRAPAPTL